MDMLQYVHMPKFRGVMVRRTTPMLRGVGGLLDTANNMYKDVIPDVKIKPSSMEYIFPSGAEIKLCHCEREADKHNFQGWQVASFLIDEAQQMLESQVIYFTSRMRTMADMKPVMKLTCNPEYNSFLRVWLQKAGYLDEDNYGIPRPEMDGVEMYFIRQGNEMIWEKDRSALEDKYGVDSGITSFRFISATCRDNPILLKHDPQYENRLRALPRIERMRLLEGAWLVQEESAGMYKRSWTQSIKFKDLPDMNKLVRAYDLAGSIPSEKYPDPDYTVSILMGEDNQNNIYILDMTRYRKRYAAVIDSIVETGEQDIENWDGGVTTYIPEDPNSSGKAAAQQMVNQISSKGILVKKIKSSNLKNRKVREFEPFAVAAENNMVYVVEAAWNEIFHEELELFDPSVRVSGLHDDIVDATAQAYLKIQTSNVFRPITLPSMNNTTRLSQYRKSLR